jgi:hypothetical protein
MCLCQHMGHFTNRGGPVDDRSQSVTLDRWHQTRIWSWGTFTVFAKSRSHYSNILNIFKLLFVIEPHLATLLEFYSHPSTLPCLAS